MLTRKILYDIFIKNIELGGKMVRFVSSIDELSFSKLMTVYNETNGLTAKNDYQDIPDNERIFQVESDFYAYLKECFFVTDGASYVILEENNIYLSVARVEPFLDGIILEALETDPHFRGRGYAKELVGYIVEHVNCPVYSHVSLDNVFSQKVHIANGFKIISNYADYINGTRSYKAVTFKYER